MLKVKIYAIKNPNTDEVIYVGASLRPEQRFAIHENGAEWHPITYRYKQIRLMKAAKIKPVLVILCECDYMEVREKEEYYINYFISLGNRLGQNKRSGYPQRRTYLGELRWPSAEV